MNLWSQRYIFFLKEKGFKGKMCFHKACEEENAITLVGAMAFICYGICFRKNQPSDPYDLLTMILLQLLNIRQE